MKKLNYLILLLSIGLTLSCSSEDDEVANLDGNNTNSAIIGIWDESPNLDGNTYTYKSDGTAIYVNTRDDENGSQTWTYEGAWKVIDDNVLIEYYPDSDEEWDNNWENNPTLKHYFKLLNDCTLELTRFYSNNSNNNVIRHYKHNEENCYDDMQEAREFEISIGGYSTPAEAFPLKITYYSSDVNGDISTTVVNTQTNTDVVQVQVLECYDKIGFKYEVIDNGETHIGGVRIKDVALDLQVLSTELEISNNQVFMYSIHQDTYTIE
ncbi:hypothetical protein ACFQ3R_06110 [Mesonia ostreae]|uniref:Lipocalin-like domain-containing protein n=1 Tax=Mesonia ostreae TaxID=861110 RepID=A0ABU2KH94_9FLAO|nr:hypothetical protein [Mesonia ostreae]MDT0294086.1 hypothetical protein [Mesonia ostreae]